MNLFYRPDIAEGVHQLEAEESRHCIKVLRKKQGDTIHLTNGEGWLYTARITEPSTHACSFEIIESALTPALPYSIHLAVAPTKNLDRTEWLVEKCVEFGIDKITLMACDHAERTYSKTDRLNKVAISAMKQSLKTRLPAIHSLTDFSAVIQESSAFQKFIAHVDAANRTSLKDVAKPSSSYMILIGPEGDFSDREVIRAIENGFTKVSLGPTRLRTETAGIAACHILNLINT